MTPSTTLFFIALYSAHQTFICIPPAAPLNCFPTLTFRFSLVLSFYLSRVRNTVIRFCSRFCSRIRPNCHANLIKSKRRFSKLWRCTIAGMLASTLHRIGFIFRPSFDILLRHVIVKGYWSFWYCNPKLSRSKILLLQYHLSEPVVSLYLL